MNQEKISYEQMRDKATSLRTSANKLQVIFDQAKVEIGKLGTEDTWKSQAADQFVEKFNGLAAKFPDFITKVNDCATFIDNTVNAYETSDQKIGQSANEYLNS